MLIRTRISAALLALLALPALLGCEAWRYTPKGESPLAPISLSTDGAELEILVVRFPLGEPELNGPLWSQIDEQQFPAELRRELTANGLRAGLIAGPMPDILARKLAAADDQSTPGAAAARLEANPPVKRWRLLVHRGRAGKIVTSNVYDQLSLLTHDPDGQVRGKTFPHAQGYFTSEVDPQGDGRVRIALAPELQYGEARQEWVGEDGVFQMQTGQPKQTFDKLHLAATLAPNQMLVLASLADRPGSLGHYLFTEPKSGGTDQKLLIIRLADTKYDDLFVEATEAGSSDRGHAPTVAAEPPQK